MSEKELLYIEDALGHLKFMETKCNECAKKLQDSELKEYVEQLATKHKELFGKFYQILTSQ